MRTSRFRRLAACSRPVRLLGALALACLAAGCVFTPASQPPPRSFVLVPKEPAKPLSASPRFDDAVEVRGFTAPRRIGKSFATLDLSTGELSYDAALQWADKPEELATAVVARRLEAAGLFAGVRQQSSGHRPRYSLGGRVRAFRFESPTKGAGTMEAAVELELSLLDTEEGRQIWWGTVERHVAVGSAKSPESMVAAMSEATASAADMVSRALGAIEPPAPLDAGPSE